MKFKNLTSDLRLGIRMLFVLPVKKLFAPPGLQSFARSYFPEGLVPTTVADRAGLTLAARCVGCGLCDAAVGSGPRPSLLATTFSKASADLAVLAGDLAAMPAARLEAAEALCPERVPLVELRRSLLERLGRLEGQRAPDVTPAGP